MTQIALTTEEFAKVKAMLHADPHGLKVVEQGDTLGTISGKKFIISWAANYSYANGLLTVTAIKPSGHIVEIERGVNDALIAALEQIRKA